MVNPLWIWRALSGKSVTFAVLCAFALLGASIFSWIRSLAHWLGASGIMVWLLPIALSAVIASKEAEWIPSARTRRILAWSLFGASILASLILGYLAHPGTAQEAQNAY
jgi:hypothetical protein